MGVSIINDLLFTQIKTGDIYAFEILFTKYYRKLKQYGGNYVSKEVAEEIAADVLQKIWERRSEIEINLSLEAYLFRCVRNQSLNLMRDHQRNGLDIILQSDMLSGDLPGSDEEGASDFSYPFLEKEKEEFMGRQADQLNELLRYLPFPHKEVFELRKKGLKYKEIASQLNLSEKTVRNSLERTVRKLRSIVKSVYPFSARIKNIDFRN